MFTTPGPGRRPGGGGEEELQKYNQEPSLSEPFLSHPSHSPPSLPKSAFSQSSVSMSSPSAAGARMERQGDSETEEQEETTTTKSPRAIPLMHNPPSLPKSSLSLSRSSVSMSSPSETGDSKERGDRWTERQPRVAGILSWLNLRVWVSLQKPLMSIVPALCKLALKATLKIHGYRNQLGPKSDSRDRNRTVQQTLYHQDRKP